MNLSELKIEVINTTPKGGQHVGIISTGVKVTHIPTKLVAQCESHRSQMLNRNVAISMIEWGLSEIGWEDK